AEARIEQIRQAPGQHVAAHPVHHRNQIEKPARHWKVGDIGRPHLADPLDLKPAQKVRIDPMLWCRLAGTRALVDGRQSHPQHQALHPLAIHRMALCLKPRRHPPPTVEGSLQVLAIDECHQFQFVGAGPDRLIVECGAAQPQKLALPAKRKRTLSFEHRKPPLPPDSSATVASPRSAVSATLALKAGSCLRRLADIVCLLARFSAGVLEGRIYLSQLSKFRGPPQGSRSRMMSKMS